ncbi:hypothetical protein [Acinetobacter venetianus]|uniref:hypothetical protein n=1 Tax=Acinetobacter venetianus TaxID=52133 RepID=UPI0011474332|nr:hypothetical protein [Acinetobacter venetianus]
MMKNTILIFLGGLFPFSVLAGEIEWKVENPFRFIQDAQNDEFKIEKSQSTLDFVQQRMKDRNTAKFPPITSTQWIRDPSLSQRLPSGYAFPKTVLISAWLPKDILGVCEWRYGEFVEKRACNEKVTFNAQTQFGDMSKTFLSVNILESGKLIKEQIIVKDRLILGVGDSYASGEGNPDIPTVADPQKIDNLAKNNATRIISGRWMKYKDSWVQINAEWLDRQCHRSFFSQHILAGMKLASMNTKESITLIPLACSGAEVLDGVLISQANPPGGGRRVTESQLNAAIRYLCPSNTQLQSSKKYFHRVYTGGTVKVVGEKRLKCAGQIRMPDAILLSIGGNDVGFSPAITWAALPNGHRNFFGWSSVKLTNKFIKPICPKYTDQKLCQKNRPVAKDRVNNWLSSYYSDLATELLDAGMSQDGSNIYLTAYPNPSFIEDGKTLCSVKQSADVLEQARTQLPRIVRTGVWEIQITPSELQDINVGLIEPLYNKMKHNAEIHRWNFIDQHVNQTLNHGVCAGYHRDMTNFPIFPHVRQGEWYPQKPTEEWAFDVSKQRWFRNTNDSLLFQTDDTSGSINGAFHPDFRMHAFIADVLAEKIRQKWK